MMADADNMATLAKRNIFFLRASKLERDVELHGLTDDEVDGLLADLMLPDGRIKDHIEQLEAQLAEAREALEPFARTNVIEPDGVIVGLERYHFKRARTLYQRLQQPDKAVSDG